MKLANWLYHTAAQACRLKSDFACAVFSDGLVERAHDVSTLLDTDKSGWTLLTFYQPSTEILWKAADVGVIAVYSVLTDRDWPLLESAGFAVPERSNEAMCGLKATHLPFVRSAVLRERFGVTPKARPRDKTPSHWLRIAAARAASNRSNYMLLVRDSKLVAEGVDLARILKDDVAGSTLYSFRELTPSELGHAEDAHIGCVYIAVTRHDASRIGLWPAHLKQALVQRVREQLITDVVKNWQSSGV